MPHLFYLISDGLSHGKCFWASTSTEEGDSADCLIIRLSVSSHLLLTTWESPIKLKKFRIFKKQIVLWYVLDRGIENRRCFHVCCYLNSAEMDIWHALTKSVDSFQWYYPKQGTFTKEWHPAVYSPAEFCYHVLYISVTF